MKFTCSKEKFKEGILVAERITGKNLTLPILNNLLLTAEDNVLKIRATNLDLGIEVAIPAKIEKKGTVSAAGSILGGLISNLYDNMVNAEVSGENLKITTKNNSAVVKTQSYDDFPTLPLISKGTSFSIPTEKFILGLKSVWYSASVSDIKPETSSVCIYSDDGSLVFAATDSFRLAEKKIPLVEKVEVPTILLPFKNISSIIKVFDAQGGDIVVRFNSNQFSLSKDGLYLTSRIIDGVFPDYKQIIPKNFSTEAVILKQDLVNSLKIANVFSDKFNRLQVRVVPHEKRFELQTSNTDLGENTVRVDGAFSGDPASLSFNYKYIVDCLNSITKDSVSLRIDGESKPLVIQGVGDKSFLYLVMPLNQ